MSGIVGFFGRNGQPVVPELVSGMAQAIAHRGRDGMTSLCEGTIGFGHLKTHTTRESHRESQPLVLDPPGLVLVADARIDNRDELKSQLGVGTGLQPTDAELILLAYRQWGSECAARLCGDFAFAIWDRTNRQLFCARDPMGVKPFYYYECDRFFAFATEPKALFALPIPRRISERQMALYLMGTRQDRDETPYEGIRRLPAAHTLSVNARASMRREYWRVDEQPEVRYSTADQYTEAFRELFLEAVRARLRSTAPVSAALSGGLDSSSIVCAARLLRTKESNAAPLHTFSLIFSDLPQKEQRLIDERAYAESVIRGGGIEPHFVRGDAVSPLTDVRQVLWHLDEPYGAPNLFLHWSMYAAAADRGARVFLDGLDGDSAVSHGLGRLNGLAKNGQWPVFESEVRSFAQYRGLPPQSVLYEIGYPYLADLAVRGKWITWLRAAAQLTRRFQLSPRTVAARFGAGPALGRALRLLRRRPSVEQRILRKPLVRHVRDRIKVDPAPVERDAHIRGISQPLYQLALEMADKCAAAFGIEPRYPFFDRRLIEFCIGLPDDQKFGGGWSRLVMRRAMEGILPTEIQWRPTKANLSPNFHARFRAADRRTVEQTDQTQLAHYVDPQAYNQLMRNYFADSARTWGDPETELLFRATTLAIWLSETSHNNTTPEHCGVGHRRSA